MKLHIFVVYLLLAVAGPVFADGCLIGRVDPQSAAQRAGLQRGDVIVQAASTTIRGIEDLVAVVRSAGESFPMKIERGRQSQEITVYLDPPAPERARLGVVCDEDSKAGYAQFFRDERNDTLTLEGGAAFPLSGITNSGPGGWDSRIGSTGYEAGAQYMHYVAPRFGVGVDLNYTASGTASSSSLFGPTAQSTIRYDSFALMAAFRWNKPAHAIIPFIHTGIGLHYSRLQLDVAPSPTEGLGYIPAFQQPATAVNDWALSIALALGFGVDYFVTSSTFVGCEARVQYLGPASYDGENQPGLVVEDFKGSIWQSHLLARIGWKF